MSALSAVLLSVLREHGKRAPIRRGDSACIVIGWRCQCGTETDAFDGHLASVLADAIGAELAALRSVNSELENWLAERLSNESGEGE